MEGSHKTKSLVREKLIWAVGEVLRTQSYIHLTGGNISDVAGISLSRIYDYFSSVDKLMVIYWEMNENSWITRQVQEYFLPSSEAYIQFDTLPEEYHWTIFRSTRAYPGH